jgi:Cu/Ag efflux pump CusA
MWIVKVALNRPYTFIVLALLILIAAPVVIMRTPTDIFPNINIPVVSIGWTYTGLNPEEFEGRLDLPPFSHPFITRVFSVVLMVVVGEGRGAMAPLPSMVLRNSLGVR